MTIPFKNTWLACLGMMLLVTGCAKYSPKPLGRSYGVSQESEGVFVAAHMLSYNDCKRVFSRNIEKKGYKAVQLSITNNSDHTYVLDGQQIRLNLEPVRYVARDMQLKTVKRVLTWVVPGILFMPVLFPMIYIGAFDGTKCVLANRKLMADFQQRCIDRSSRLHILPQSTTTRVMFIRNENYCSKLLLTLDSLTDGQSDLRYTISL